MFEEVVVKLNLGCKVLPGHLVVGRFGQNQARSIVAISQTFDKLVVHDLSSLNRNDSKISHDIDDWDSAKSSSSNNFKSPVYYIAVKDVIKTVSVKSLEILSSSDIMDNNVESLNDSHQVQKLSQSLSKDLLLVGCSSSILIYDAFTESNLFNIITSTSIVAITKDFIEPTDGKFSVTNQLTICGGPQKIYSIKFESRLGSNTNIEAEISSERSTTDTITCMVQGKLNGIDLVLTGCAEQKIRVYPLDSFDQNIQPSKITIEESGHINCLCPIYTASGHPREMATTVESKSLPSVGGQKVLPENGEQMNYFAYGVENGVIGVYRILDSTTNSGSALLTTERQWRHKCKYAPLAIMMFDINGDGFDELLVGFKNSRIEARSPFTGQLLATTRCFKTERLVGLTVIDYFNDGRLILLASSSAGFMVGYRPDQPKARMPLQGYNLPRDHQLDAQSQDRSNPMTAHTSGITNLRTIVEERDVFMREGVDLHIESQNDDTKSSKCEARQSLDLLQKINALQGEQMDLERRACHIYRSSLHEIEEFFPSDVSIAYRWDFDSTTIHLRLTIVVNTGVEHLKLIKLEDSSGNFLENTYLFVNPNEEKQLHEGGKSHVIVVPLRSVRHDETKLNLQIFCQIQQEQNMARVYNQLISVPKYSMFTFGDDDQNKKLSSAETLESSERIRISLQLKKDSEVEQLLSWLEENFLCFQFGRLVKNPSYHSERTSSPQALSTSVLRNHNLMMDDDNIEKNFQLNLLDIKLMLDRMATLEQDALNAFESRPTFGELGSTLRIVLSSGLLTFESESSDLVMDLVRSLLIDRLHLETLHDKLKQGIVISNLQPILNELDIVSKSSAELEESERRIQSELYESADYTGNLMQQFAIANDLNEFTIAKTLLSELLMMLNGAQNAARAHCLNNRSRSKLSKRINELREKISFLSGQFA